MFINAGSGEQTLSVLVVDDSPEMRSFIRRVLEASGIPAAGIHEAGNGRPALEILATTPVDLVLSDINMPGMSGTQMMQEIAASPELRTIPVIIVSADSSPRQVKSMMKLGVRGFLQKPFHPDSLRSVVRHVLVASV